MRKAALLHLLIVPCVLGWILAVAISVACQAETAKPPKGMALVIGQANYLSLKPLPNPENDARAMDEILRALGFETTVAIDLNQRKLARAIANFTEDAEGRNCW